MIWVVLATVIHLRDAMFVIMAIILFATVQDTRLWTYKNLKVAVCGRVVFWLLVQLVLLFATMVESLRFVVYSQRHNPFQYGKFICDANL